MVGKAASLSLAILLGWASLAATLAIVRGRPRLRADAYLLLGLSLLGFPLGLAVLPTFGSISVPALFIDDAASISLAIGGFFKAYAGPVIALYVGGVLVLLTRLLVGLYLGSRLVSDAVDVSRAVEERTGIRLGVGAKVLESPRIRGPSCFGVRRRIILLPPTWSHWSLKTLRVALAHELAHIRARDPRKRVLAALVRAVYWVHPVVWVIARQVRAFAELAADRSGFLAAGSIAAYRHAFEEIRRTQSRTRAYAHVMVAMGDRPLTLRRIERIRLSGRPNLGRGERDRFAALAAVSLAVLIALGFRVGSDPGGLFAAEEVASSTDSWPPSLTGDYVGSWTDGDRRTTAAWTKESFLLTPEADAVLGEVAFARGGGRIEVSEVAPGGVTHVRFEGDGAGGLHLAEAKGAVASLGPEARNAAVRRMLASLYRETPLVDVAIQRGLPGSSEIRLSELPLDVESPALRGSRTAARLLAGEFFSIPFDRLLHDDLSRRSFLVSIFEEADHLRSEFSGDLFLAVDQVIWSFDETAALARTMTHLHDLPLQIGVRAFLLQVADRAIADPNRRRIHLASIASHFQSEPALAGRFATSVENLPTEQAEILKAGLALASGT